MLRPRKGDDLGSSLLRLNPTRSSPPTTTRNETRSLFQTALARLRSTDQAPRTIQLPETAQFPEIDRLVNAARRPAKVSAPVPEKVAHEEEEETDIWLATLSDPPPPPPTSH